MKNYTFTLILFLSLTTLFAQFPQKMSYQSVIRKTDGTLLVNTLVGIKISILQGTESGTAVYVETQTPNTNANGLVSLAIGGGTPATGTLTGIDWSTGNYFIKTEIDPVGGTNYSINGTSQLLSVPYALYAMNTGYTPTLQQVLDSGNTANKIVTDADKSSIKLNTSGGNTSNAIYYGLQSIITGTNGSNRAIQGYSNGTNQSYNEGVLGFATNSMSENVGIYGAGFGSTAYNTGVKGEASGAIDGKENIGVIGRSIDFSATGKNYGVIGIARKSEVLNVAVGAFSDGASTTNGYNYGVMSRATSTTTNGTNYGIYSQASNGAVNYAGFFNGNVTITGTLVQPSDKKLKKDIKPFTAALDKIKALKPVTYYYKTERESGINLPKDLQYGFIAQDIETVLPELVTKQILNLGLVEKIGNQNSLLHPEEGIITPKSNPEKISTADYKIEEFKGINYNGLIAILTEALKEQQSIIEKMKIKNNVLEERVSKLEKASITK